MAFVQRKRCNGSPKTDDDGNRLPAEERCVGCIDCLVQVMHALKFGSSSRASYTNGYIPLTDLDSYLANMKAAFGCEAEIVYGSEHTDPDLDRSCEPRTAFFTINMDV